MTQSHHLRKIHQLRSRFIAKEIIFDGFLFSLILSFVLGGLVTLDRKLKENLSNEEKTFQWLVFVQGEPLEIDDAGRALSQFPHVKTIHYLSPKEAFEQVANVNGITSESEGIDINSLPGVWQVMWDFNPRALGSPDDIAADMKIIKGVTDVAFDRNMNMHILDLLQYQKVLRISLGVFMVAGFLWSLFLLGHIFYLQPWKIWSSSQLAQVLFVDELGWGIGFFGMVKIMKGLPPLFLVGGLVLGLLHFLILIRNRAKNGSLQN